MARRSLKSVLIAIALVLSMMACDEDPTDAGDPDATPPVVTALTPRDIYHVDVTFDEEVTELSAQNRNHYLLTKTAAPSPVASQPESALGDSMYIAAAVLKPNK